MEPFDPTFELRMLHFMADCRMSGIENRETQKDAAIYEVSTGFKEKVALAMKLASLGDKIVPLALWRAKRSPELRSCWEGVLTFVDTPGGQAAMASLQQEASGENYESMSTADLITILRRTDSLIQLSRVNAIAQVLKSRDETAVEAVIDAIRMESHAMMPQGYNSLMVVAHQLGPAVVPGLIGLLNDPNFGHGIDSVVGVLGKIRDTRAIQPLCELRDRSAFNSELPKHVAWALRQIEASGNISSTGTAGPSAAASWKIPVVCPHCGRKAKAAPDHQGKMAKCPGCNKRIPIVPEPRDAELAKLGYTPAERDEILAAVDAIERANIDAEIEQHVLSLTKRGMMIVPFLRVLSQHAKAEDLRDGYAHLANNIELGGLFNQLEAALAKADQMEADYDMAHECFDRIVRVGALALPHLLHRIVRRQRPFGIYGFQEYAAMILHQLSESHLDDIRMVLGELVQIVVMSRSSTPDPVEIKSANVIITRDLLQKCTGRNSASVLIELARIEGGVALVQPYIEQLEKVDHKFPEFDDNVRFLLMLLSETKSD